MSDAPSSRANRFGPVPEGLSHDLSRFSRESELLYAILVDIKGLRDDLENLTRALNNLLERIEI
jgi:hypothetical protein